MTRAEVRRLAGAASTTLQDVLAGPARRADWLGVSPSALYLTVRGIPGPSGSEVVSVLTHDAVRLPAGLVLASTAAELPLTGLVPGPGDIGAASCTVGGGQVRWSWPAGAVVITAVRLWVPATVTPGPVAASAIRQVRSVLDSAETGLVPGQVAALRGPACGPAAATALIGCGPGLTPSGDDVLAGFLIGLRAFALPAPGVQATVASMAGERTTALSARLLWHAARGECIPELAALAAAMQGRGDVQSAVHSLLAVGHTSGAALGLGLLLSAERAARHLDAVA
jgi:Protein of unknown function (DUF2877)